MRIIGCDLHARQQTLAMLDTATGEVERTTLRHEGEIVREFYSKFPGPVRVGIVLARGTGPIEFTGFTKRQSRRNRRNWWSHCNLHDKN